MGSERGSEFEAGGTVITMIQDKKHCTAVVLAAGQGTRMGTSVRKQYIELKGNPLICYTLAAFQESEVIDDVVLVVGEGEEDYVYNEIVQKYHFYKVRAIVKGGEERYASVWQGLKIIKNGAVPEVYPQGYVFIHDGARPFVEEAILERAYETVEKYKACVAGMPSKDTVKLLDEDGFAKETPQRNCVWAVQTPQVFESGLIIEAYSRLMREDSIKVTDDAMVVEQTMDTPVKLFEGSYENIKITTPEDLEIAEVFLKRKFEI